VLLRYGDGLVERRLCGRRAKTMALVGRSSIGSRKRWRPAFEQMIGDAQDLHLDGITVGLAARVRPPNRDREIATRARGGGDEQVNLRKQLENGRRLARGTSS
jgi:hypothetical protein